MQTTIVKQKGATFYYKKGTHHYHNDNGPAVKFNDGSLMFYIDGKKHREGAPAVIWIEGKKEWWINGVRLCSDKEMLLNIWYENKNHELH